ncbi:SUMO ligase MMS21, partial [Aspergillus vadensis CBS 113365]
MYGVRSSYNDIDKIKNPSQNSLAPRIASRRVFQLIFIHRLIFSLKEHTTKKLTIYHIPYTPLSPFSPIPTTHTHTHLDYTHHTTPHPQSHSLTSTKRKEKQIHTKMPKRPITTPRRRDRERESTPPLPPYEPPTSTLTTLSQQPTTAPALSALLATHTSSTLKTHLQHAQEKLTDAAGEINERLTDAKERSKKAKERKRNLRQRSASENNNDGDGEGDGSEDEDEEGGIEEFEERVKATTKVLEETIRGVIDKEVRGEEVGRVIAGLEGGVVERMRARGVRRSQRGVQLRRRRGRGDEDGSEEEEGEGEEEEGGDAEEDEEGAVPFLAQFEGELQGKMEEYNGMSLTRRYTTNNSYIGFYKIIHEAKHIGDEIPPPPHPSTWFSHLEDPHSQPPSHHHPSTSTTTTTSTSTRQTKTTTTTRSHPRHPSPSASEDDEIAIQTERISLKCPLTLLPFRDPVSSTKCPHSFEREAIYTMISGSNQMVPDPRGSSGSGGGCGRARKRVRSVKCPVCEVQLTEFDLRSDPVLVRRVKRAEMAELREREREMLGENQDR